MRMLQVSIVLQIVSVHVKFLCKYFCKKKIIK